MKLILPQQELEQAVRSYVTGMISLQAGTNITIDFKAGRGDNGFTAEVDISYLDVKSLPTTQIRAAAPVDKAPEELPAPVPKKTSSAPVEEDQTETRTVTGKSLFGKDEAKSEDAAAANDDDADGKAEPAKPAAAAGRKTLFTGS